MAERKPQWPELGDLAIATIEMVAEDGAYAKLDEYGKRGFLHVSEVYSSWNRKICDFNRENQEIVIKAHNEVTNVSKVRGQDLLRREK